MSEFDSSSIPEPKKGFREIVKGILESKPEFTIADGDAFFESPETPRLHSAPGLELPDYRLDTRIVYNETTEQIDDLADYPEPIDLSEPMLPSANIESVPPEITDIVGGFMDDTRAVFEAEHKLAPPPKPNNDELMATSRLISSNYVDFCLDFDHTPPPEPTIAEKIESAEETKKNTGDSENLINRRHYNRRKRHNFGVEWNIATSYYLPAKSQLIEVDEVAILNRVDLYRYLQQRGIVLMDDTGLTETGSQMTYMQGITMTPSTINVDDFYALEDIVRDQFPFETDQLRRLKLERMVAAGYTYESEAKEDGFVVSSEEFRAPPDAIRKIVDQLSLDERFADMFAAGDKIVEARKQRSREEVNTDQAAQEPDLPTLTREQPIQHDDIDLPTLER